MAWFRNKYLAGVIASSLLISCSGSETKQQRPGSSPAPLSSNRPKLQQPNASPQPSPSAKPGTNSKPSTHPAAKKPPSSSPPKINLSTSEKKLISKVEKEVQKTNAIAKQDSGQSYLGNVLRSQQATKLVKGRFTPNLKDLQADLPENPSEYQLQVLEANEEKAIVVAIAKQSGIFSYTGAVYSREASIPVSSICKSNEPTKTPPGAPKLVGSNIICAQGSTAIK